MNWGVLGCANIAISSVIPALIKVSKNDTITVASRNIEKAKKTAKEFGCEYTNSYDDLLSIDSINAIYIPLPTGLHFEWIMKAIEKEKHILVEKSAAICYIEAQQIIELAKNKNVAVVENFQFQHHSQHQHVFDLLKANEIGEIRAFRSSFGFPPFSEDTNIRYDKSLGGGALLDSGAYVLKATSFIMGNGFEVKSSFLNYNDKFNVDWFGGAFLVNKEKNIFSEVAFGFDNFYQCNYEIWGSKGKITVTRAFTAKADFNPNIILEKQGYKEEIELPKDDHFLNMILYFTNIVNNESFEKEWDNLLVQAKLIDQVVLTSKK